MRKIITIGFIIAGVVISCKKEEITPTKPIVAIGKDCNCDRVVSVNEFNLNDGTKFGSYVTINDCSGIQKNKDWKYNKPYIGECKK